jgi:uncharacterized protein YdhG (YjbR/CyaY superfamily)
MMNSKTITSINAYLKQFSPEVVAKLRTLRKIIQTLAPQAEEAIRYGMPTFRLNGNLIHFAAYENHIGLYPTPAPIKAFAKELKSYKTSKGAIQFPIDKPLPLTLIKKIIKYRVKQNLTKSKK